MDILRRDILKYMVSGSATIALRSAVTGIPVFALQAVASSAAFANTLAYSKPQYLLLNLSQKGDPFNINCPGSYDSGLPVVFNNPTTAMSPVPIKLGSTVTKAAQPWSVLPQWVLDRTTFIHHRTYQNIHSQFDDVMSLVGSTRGPNGETSQPEHLSSIISAAMSESNRLATIQRQPINLGGPNVSYSGQAVQKMSPSGFSSLLAPLDGVDKELQQLRDRETDAFAALLRQSAGGKLSRTQGDWLEQHVRSKNELRQLNQDIVSQFSDIKNTTTRGEMDAALLCFKLNLSPVVTMGIDFGGDNHNDAGFQNEANQTIQALNDLAYFYKQLEAKGLKDNVTLANLAVFGRTFKRDNDRGRSHNLNHHVMSITGANIQPSVVGGLMPVGNDIGAASFSSKTGLVNDNADIHFNESLESAARTLATSVGVSADVLDARIRKKDDAGNEMPVGKVITASLRS